MMYGIYLGMFSLCFWIYIDFEMKKKETISYIGYIYP